MSSVIRMDLHKQDSLVTWAAKRMRPVFPVVVPLRYGSEEASRACVNPGDSVRAGDVIARAASAAGLTRHASVSGRVREIGMFQHPLGGRREGIWIEPAPFGEPWRGGPEAKFSGGESLFSFFRSKGLVDFSRDMEPLHTKLQRFEANRPEVLIINGCDAEPYLTSHYALAMAHPLEILKGAEWCRKAAGIARLIFVFQQDQEHALELLRSKIFFQRLAHVEVITVPAAYPHGLDEMVLRAVVSKHLASSESSRGFSAQMLQMATAYAAYEALELGKPLMERLVTVAGECAVEAHNVWLPLGVSFQDAFRACGGFLRDPAMVLMNGPMIGWPQKSVEVPVLPAASAVLALPPERVARAEEAPCNRCGDCVQACPSGLSPADITLAVERGLSELTPAMGLEACIRCGLCAYVCPSERPMQKLIAEAFSALGTQSPSLPAADHFAFPVSSPLAPASIQ